MSKSNQSDVNSIPQGNTVARAERTSMTKWIVLLIGVYLIGNLAAFYLSSYLFDVDQAFGWTIPLIFLTVPVVGVYIVKRGKLLSTPGRIRDASVAILALYILTWIFLLYICLMNFLPETFPQIGMC